MSENNYKKSLKEQYKCRACIGGIYRIRCITNSKQWLRSTLDLNGAKNRFQFSVAINSSPENCMAEDWKLYGASSFVFETLEELTKKETQTNKEFADDITTLLELWNGN